MIGRHVILTSRAFTLEELHDFMKKHWDCDTFNSFILGKPTPLSVKEYIILPASPRFVTIIETAKAGGLFNKDNKVILSTADSPNGAMEGFLRITPGNNVLASALKVGSLMSAEKERKGPAEEVLQEYAKYLTELLGKEGYLK